MAETYFLNDCLGKRCLIEMYDEEEIAAVVSSTFEAGVVLSGPTHVFVVPWDSIKQFSWPK